MSCQNANQALHEAKMYQQILMSRMEVSVGYWSRPPLTPDISFRRGVRGDVGRVLEALPVHCVVGVGVWPRQPVRGAQVVVEERPEYVDVVRVAVTRDEARLRGVIVALQGRNGR